MNEIEENPGFPSLEPRLVPGLSQAAQNRILAICYGRNQIELGGSRCAAGDISPVLDSSCRYLKIVGSRFSICFRIFSTGRLQVGENLEISVIFQSGLQGYGRLGIPGFSSISLNLERPDKKNSETNQKSASYDFYMPTRAA